MPRRYEPRERIQLSVRTLFAVMATVPLLVWAINWIAMFSWSVLGSTAVGATTAVVAYRLLEREEVRSLLSEILVFVLVATYALWIPTSIAAYVVGAACGLLIAWQWPILLSLMCLFFGIARIKVYPMPHWRPRVVSTLPDRDRQSSRDTN
jgi:hypothetical protein